MAGWRKRARHCEQSHLAPFKLIAQRHGFWPFFTHYFTSVASGNLAPVEIVILFLTLSLRFPVTTI
jgi:hypothetical protein